MPDYVAGFAVYVTLGLRQTKTHKPIMRKYRFIGRLHSKVARPITQTTRVKSTRIRDFILAMSGVLIGGIITLSGTVLQAKLATDKELRTEMRTKLELLVHTHYLHRSCHMGLVAGVSLDKACSDDWHGNKAVSLAQIYFPELLPALYAYNLVSVNSQTARFRCDYFYAKDPEKLLNCVNAIPAIHNESASVIVEIARQSQKLRGSGN